MKPKRIISEESEAKATLPPSSSQSLPQGTYQRDFQTYKSMVRVLYLFTTDFEIYSSIAINMDRYDFKIVGIDRLSCNNFAMNS